MSYSRSLLRSSRSTASRMKSERFSPSLSVASMRASVPSRNRAGVCSPLILGRPTGSRLQISSFFAKLRILLISPIDAVRDITYVGDISYGGKAMIIRVSQMSREALRDLERHGKSPESRWLASRELKRRGYSA